MDVRRTALVGTFLFFLWSLALGQAQGKKHDQTGELHAHKRDNSFLQYTLDQINSTDVDYGSRLVRWRKALVERSLENGYFWSNTVALSLLVCLSLSVAYQRNVQHRRDWATAEIVDQYEHALGRANVQIEELTSKNHALAAAIAHKREQAMLSLSATPSIPEETSLTDEAAHTKRSRIEPSRTAVSKDARRTQKPVQVTENGSQITLFTPEVDLMMTVNSLKQQLAHSEEKNTVLQRRIESARRNREPKKQSGPNVLDVRSMTAEQEEHTNGN